MLAENQQKITELHKKIADIHAEINTIRLADVQERKELRRGNILPRREYSEKRRKENYYDERLWKRWEQWEVDLYQNTHLSTKEIARLTGRSLLAVESKLFKLQHELNEKEAI